jgi:hypothetical protein
MDVVAAWQGTSRGGTLQVSAGTAPTGPIGTTAPAAMGYGSHPTTQPQPQPQQPPPAAYAPPPAAYAPPPASYAPPPLYAVPLTAGSGSFPGPPQHHLFRPYGQPVTTNNYFYAEPAQTALPQAAPAATPTPAPSLCPASGPSSWPLWQWLVLAFLIALTVLVLVHVCLTGKLSRRLKKVVHGAAYRE